MHKMEFNNWIKANNDKKIIITDRVANANRLFRKYNKETGMARCNVEVFTLYDIAKELLEAYCGFKVKKMSTIIDAKSGVYVIDKLLRNNRLSFIPTESLCVKTSKEVFSSINQIRTNRIKDVALEFGKIAELNKLIDSYEKELKNSGCLDDIMLLKEANVIIKNSSKEDLSFCMPWVLGCDFGILEGYEMTIVEQEFMDGLVAMSGKEPKLLEIEDNENKAVVQYEFFKAYGSSNEVEYVINCIEEERLAFGDVNVLYTSDEYEGLIKSAFESKRLPYRFSTGNSIAGTNVIQFLIGILNWAENDYLYEDLAVVADNPCVTLKNIAPEEATVNSTSHYYNKYLRKRIGWGRERYFRSVDKGDDEELFNKFLGDLAGAFEDVTNIACLYEKLIQICSTYVAKNKENNQLVALLKDQIKVFKMIGEVDADNAIRYIKDYILELKEREESNTAFVNLIKLSQFEVLDRSENFVIGLSAKEFSVDSKESAVLSDEELKQYVDGRIKLSIDIPKQKRDDLKRSLSTINKGRIIMGYSMFDTVNLRDNFPSAFYLEYEEQYRKSDVKVHTYDVVKSPIIFNGKSLIDRIVEEETIDTPVVTNDIRISASGLQKLISCPLEYYYSYVEHLTERSFIKKSNHTWLDALSKGNLFHYFMEEYCNRLFGHEEITKATPDKELCDEIYNLVIERMIEEMPYTSYTIFEKERDDTYELILNYLFEFHKEMYEDNQKGMKRRIIGNELRFDDVEYTFKACVKDKEDIKVTFNGGIDRLDGYVNSDGKLLLRIVDYKTGKMSEKEKEIKNDKQIQHFIYVFAALKYATDNKELLEEMFDTTITSIGIENMIYVFPYEVLKNNKLSTSDRLVNNMSGGKYNLPKEVDNLAWEVFNYIYNEKSKSKLEEFVPKEPQKLEKHCKYCCFKEQCRCWVSEKL